MNSPREYYAPYYSASQQNNNIPANYYTPVPS
jgi:hypothetical protein